jgi:hypothetical protein
MAQGERRGFEIVDDFPFMLKVLKHSEPFFSNPLGDEIAPRLFIFLILPSGTGIP